MSEEEPNDLPAILSRARSGEAVAAGLLFAQVYQHLRRLARGFLRGRADGLTLQPTAVVHEAYLRMIRGPQVWQDRNHFIAVASTAMRQILIDAARRRAADKRAGGLTRVTLSDWLLPDGSAGDRDTGLVDLLALDAALKRLSTVSPRQARIIELRCFGGMTVPEVADVLSVSTALVEKEWRRARAWLAHALDSNEPPSSHGAG
jgi:RNA polymerase sigma-70 factor (ECF subfamily)